LWCNIASLFCNKGNKIDFFLPISDSDVSESDAENERNFQFDFLIEGVYLQETLEKHLKIHNISTVSELL